MLLRKYKIHLLIIILCFLLIYLFPLYWMYVSSIKNNAQIYSKTPDFLFFQPHFHFLKVIKDVHFFLHLKNSLIIAIGKTILVTILSVGASYVLARNKGILIDMILFIIVIMQMLPPAIMATPLFVLFSMLHLNDSLFGVIIAASSKSVPFSIILYRIGFMALPKEIEDAGIVDGCSRAQVFFKLSLPLARNHILVITTLNFLQGMGEYAFSRSFLSSGEKTPITLVFSTFKLENSVDWMGVMAVSAVYVTPVIIVFLFVQRKIVAGLTAGSVKG